MSTGTPRRGSDFARALLTSTSMAALGLALVATTPSHASQWNGSVSTDWFVPANWNGGVPTNADQAIMDQVAPNPTVVGAPGAQAQEVFVGNNSIGVLTILNGGTLTSSTFTVIGNGATANGTVTVTGVGSSLVSGTNLSVGAAGVGTMRIENGGAVSNANGVIGDIAGSSGTVTVDGVGSSWTNSGNLTVGANGAGTMTIQNGGTVSNALGAIGDLSGSTGAVTVTGAGSSWINSAALRVGGQGTGTLRILNGGTVSNTVGAIANSPGSTGAVTVDGAGSSWTNSTNLAVGLRGAGTLTIANGGTVNVGGVFAIASDASSAGTLNIGAASSQAPAAPGTLNASSVTFGAGTGLIVFNHTASSYVFAPTITGAVTGTVEVDAGTTILTANNTYLGATNINGGALIVNGSIGSSALTTVNGGLLGGVGTVGNTQINAGGTFAPGPQNAPGPMTVAGTLAFQPGAFYLVQVNPTTASIANVTGTASLAGTVLANFAPGSYITRQYTILHANGGLGGTTFAGVTSNPNFNASLSYDPNNVYLNLSAALGNSVNGPSQNQINVATAINGFFNNGGVLPPNFASLFGLTGVSLATALSQLSGEAATGAQYGAFQLGNEFFGLMLDPLVYGRGPGLIAPAGVGPMRLAAQDTQSPEIALAYAKILKEPPAPAPILWEPRWSVWAGGYGGTSRTQGDPVFVGSHDVTARTGGYGAGIDYRVGPETIVGVALAGGLTNWGLAGGLGGGKSDAFQAGLYGITRNGPAYVAGALAFAEHWMTTDRFAFAGDHLTASFNAQNYGGRIEGGWRFATFLGGVAPYAAVQAQSFHTPAYSEADATLGGFGLSYNSRNGSDTRSELGARFDHALPIAAAAVLALNARAAWAHDWVTTPVLNPLFQTLPGTLFSVTGATPVPNSALTSAGAELRFLNGWAVGGRFDGEFADRSQTYAGTGTLRYVW